MSTEPTESATIPFSVKLIEEFDKEADIALEILQKEELIRRPFHDIPDAVLSSDTTLDYVDELFKLSLGVGHVFTFFTGPKLGSKLKAVSMKIPSYVPSDNELVEEFFYI